MGQVFPTEKCRITKVKVIRETEDHHLNAVIAAAKIHRQMLKLASKTYEDVGCLHVLQTSCLKYLLIAVVV